MWQEAPLVSLLHVFSLSTYVPECFSLHICVCAKMERVATDGGCSGIMGEPPLTGERVTGAGVC